MPDRRTLTVERLEREPLSGAIEVTASGIGMEITYNVPSEREVPVPGKKIRVTVEEADE